MWGRDVICLEERIQVYLYTRRVELADGIILEASNFRGRAVSIFAASITGAIALSCLVSCLMKLGSAANV